jgi:hypothetical protein
LGYILATSSSNANGDDSKLLSTPVKKLVIKTLDISCDKETSVIGEGKEQLNLEGHLSPLIASLVTQLIGEEVEY